MEIIVYIKNLKVKANKSGASALATTCSIVEIKVNEENYAVP